MLKFKISGVYRTGQAHNADKVDFEGVEVVIPECNLDNINSFILYRVGAYFIQNDKRYPKRVEVIEQFFFDGKETGEKVDTVNPIAGKDIKDMDWLELQFVAIQFNLHGIPLINKCSLREAKEKAYKLYYDKVLNRELDDSTWEELPPCIINGGVAVKEEERLSNDDILKTGGETYTMEQLKAIALAKNIDYHPNIGYKKLFDRVFK